jgi:hypothetical protein
MAVPEEDGKRQANSDGAKLMPAALAIQMLPR